MVEFIETTHGNFVLKLAPRLRAEADVVRDLAVLAYLKARHYNCCPEIVTTGAGSLYRKLGSRVAYLLKYVEGKQPDSTPETWSKLGNATAELHSFPGFPYPTTFSLGNVKYEFKALSEKSIDKQRFMELATVLPNLDVLPKTLIHSDIGPHNTVLTPEGGVVLIDWDDAGKGVRILDLGYPLICQFISYTTNTPSFNAPNAKAFYGSYFAAIHEFTGDERRHIFDAALFYALIYSVYGDQRRNWQRIEYAQAQRRKIESLIFKI